MEVHIEKNALLPALNRACGVVERRQTLPILGNILLKAEDDRLVVVGTDLEVEIRTWCRARTAVPGETTLPARKLIDIVRNLADGAEMQLKESGDKCRLISGRGRYVLGSLSPSDFPSSQESFESDSEYSLSEGEFRRLLDKTAFAMAQQDVRYYLNGLLIESTSRGIRSVATDGHRLARYDLETDGELTQGVSVIVPFKTVGELRRLLSDVDGKIGVSVGQRAIRVALADSVVTSKLVDGKYPDYERVLPVDLTQKVRVDKGLLKQTLIRAAVLSNEKFRGVKIVFEPNLLRLQAHNPEKEEAVEELDLGYSGPCVSIGFNVAYLLDVLGAIDVDQVDIWFKDSDSSSVWRGAEKVEESFVVMPMRL